MKFHGRQKSLGVLGVIGKDIGAEFHLSAGLADPLAHLGRHDVRERIRLFVHKRGRLGDDDRPLGISLVPPSLETFRGSCDFGFKLLVGQSLKFLQNLSGGGIECFDIRRTRCFGYSCIFPFRIALWYVMPDPAGDGALRVAS